MLWPFTTPENLQSLQEWLRKLLHGIRLSVIAEPGVPASRQSCWRQRAGKGGKVLGCGDERLAGFGLKCDMAAVHDVACRTV